jgi:predicted nucleic acid-binding Zn ribbon protein
MRRAAPRPLAFALDELRERLAPATPLAAVQRAWADVAGPVIAREATPVSERGGVVTVSCRSAVWAQELDLLAPALVEGLNRALTGVEVRALRCVATGAGIRS